MYDIIKRFKYIEKNGDKMSQNNTLYTIASYKDIAHAFGDFAIYFSEPAWETPDTASVRRFQTYTELPAMHIPQENHASFDLHLCLRGKGRLELDGLMRAAGPGCVWFTSPTTRQYWHEYNKQETLVLRIPFTVHRSENPAESTPNTLISDFLQRNMNPNERPLLFGYDKSLCDYDEFLKKRMTVSSPSGFSHILLSLLLDSIDALGSIDTPMTEAQFIESYVKANVLQKISVKELSKLLSVSERSLFYIFTKNFDASPNDYINRTRMNAAAEHLSKGLSVREVSELFRFSESTSFCRMFKKYYNVTPSEFQRQAQNKQK